MARSDAEAGAGRADRADAKTAARLRTHSSSLIARILEYQLVGAIGAELLARGETLEVLKSDVDADGYDVVLDAHGIVRHIQLKAKVLGGKASKVTCHKRLQAKPSGCIIAITYDPATYQAVEYACFGGRPGERLPDIGSAVARRSTHNVVGERPLRTEHRDVRLAQFKRIEGIPELVDWLFSPSTPSLLDQNPLALPLVSSGGWAVFPISTNLTDGKALVVLAGKRAAAACEIPLVLDLIDRRWSTDSPLDDDPQVQVVLTKAAEQLALFLDPELLGKERS